MNISDVKVGDQFKSKALGHVYQIEGLYDEGRSVVYRRVDGTEKRPVSLIDVSGFLTSDYEKVEPFFIEGQKYRYVRYNGTLGSIDYTMLHVGEYEGKKYAMYAYPYDETNGSDADEPEYEFGVLGAENFNSYKASN